MDNEGREPKTPSQPRRAWLSSWLLTEHWKDALLTFDLSWFVIVMGTGVVSQVLFNFPYPAKWLHNLAYCFWVLCTLLFLLFTALQTAKSIVYPQLLKDIFLEFSQISYLGAYVISFDGIIIGTIFFYHDHGAAIWATYALYWLAMALTILVGSAAVLISCCNQQPHDISEVSAVWLLCYIPFIVTSAVGSTLVTYLEPTDQQIILIVSFLSWSVGQALCFILMCIYFWRLLAASLPQHDAMISCFIPMGPTGEGAYSIQNLAVGLGTYIQQHSYLLAREPEVQLTPETMAAIAETIDWLGVLIALFLVAFATFWLVEAASSVFLRMPKRFNVGCWAFVFPFGVYTTALCRLAQDLDNSGFRGWAAACTVLTVLVWLGCAMTTLWKGIWRLRFFAEPRLRSRSDKKELNGTGKV